MASRWLIRPKCIYNFCLFHAHLGDIAMCFATLSYLFTHIWTNLLTQCTQCQFLSADVCELQVFTHIYSAQKIPGKIYKKSAQQKLHEARRRAGGGHPPPRRPVVAAPLLAAPGGRLGGGGAPLRLSFGPLEASVTLIFYIFFLKFFGHCKYG